MTLNFLLVWVFLYLLQLPNHNWWSDVLVAGMTAFWILCLIAATIELLKDEED